MNLLLVEDDAEYAQSLSEELRALDHMVTLAPTGLAALAAVERDAFDAIILDRMLPQMDGASVLQRLRESGKRVPVLMLSALWRSSEKIEGLEAGADDYAVKPTPAPELDARLRALVRARGWGGGEGDGDTLRAGDIVVSPLRFRATRGGAVLELPKIEFRLLVELVRNAGAVVTRAMILQAVWGYDFEPASNIVEAKINALRRRLTALGDDPIVTVRGVGYMLRA